MKIKSSFVTNSSSTSYLVFIPDKFEISKFNDLIIEQTQIYDGGYSDYDDDEVLELISQGFKDLKSGGTIFQYDNNTCYNIIDQMFRELDLVISTWESGSDAGLMINVNSKPIMKNIDNIRNGGWGIKHGGWGQKSGGEE